MPAIEINATTMSRASVRTDLASASWSSVPRDASRSVAPLTSHSQAYYWSHAWQADEAESLAALAAGEGRVFGDAQSAIRWLLSSEPDD
jgi:hypothetical protein